MARSLTTVVRLLDPRHTTTHLRLQVEAILLTFRRLIIVDHLTPNSAPRTRLPRLIRIPSRVDQSLDTLNSHHFSNDNFSPPIRTDKPLDLPSHCSSLCNTCKRLLIEKSPMSG